MKQLGEPLFFNHAEQGRRDNQPVGHVYATVAEAIFNEFQIRAPIGCRIEIGEPGFRSAGEREFAMLNFLQIAVLIATTMGFNITDKATDVMKNHLAGFRGWSQKRLIGTGDAQDLDLIAAEVSDGNGKHLLDGLIMMKEFRPVDLGNIPGSNTKSFPKVPAGIRDIGDEETQLPDASEFECLSHIIETDIRIDK